MSYYDRHNNDGTDWIAFICFSGIVVLVLTSVLLWGC